MSTTDGTDDRGRPAVLQAPWHRARVVVIVSYILAATGVAGAVFILGEEVARHIRAFEAWILGLGPLALVAFMLVYAVLSSVFVPDALLGIVAGTSFGFARGLMTAAAGSVMGAALQYAVAERLAKPAIDRFVGSKPGLLAIQTAVRQQELRLQLLIRLTPLNRALTSYLLGAAGVRFTRFMAACVALLPSLCLEVYFGYAGKHLARVTSQPAHTVGAHEVALIAGLCVAIAAMVVISRTARRAVEAAAASVSSQPVGA
jgi:uncharacterized membrane protein YdjX (TVP38/TMEM64 family)